GAGWVLPRCRGKTHLARLASLARRCDALRSTPLTSKYTPRRSTRTWSDRTAVRRHDGAARPGCRGVGSAACAVTTTDPMTRRVAGRCADEPVDRSCAHDRR